ncbi:hypothetical protein VE03_10554 [Pseudogymnoascus sp. 23342-1-I1]|nr:hypothetical protein VE03_10554 [Pseudogymnoascus sp. 23342-1-I1]
MEYVGTILVNAWGALPTVLHLYNAIKHESPNADFPAWEDLDAMIKIHGKESVPFLSSLRDKIQDNILAINIDYFALHRRCFDLLRDIRTALHSDFVKFLGSPMYLEKENQLPFLH